jgi:ATP-dependent protease ClpP protease subunit
MKVLVLVLALFSCYVQAETAVDKSKAFLIEGVIGGGNLEPVVTGISDLVANGGKEVHLIINSPGGEIVTGFQFLNVMDSYRAQGVKFKCFVTNIAASMAFQILVHCDERYTLNYSFLLWHRASVGVMFARFTAPELLAVASDLQRLDSIIFGELAEHLGMDSDQVLYHFNAQTMHVGSQLGIMAPGFITVYSYIPGLLETAKSKDIIHNSTLEERARKNKKNYIYQAN